MGFKLFDHPPSQMNAFGDISYFLPCKPGSIYLNVTDQCLNNCRFCIKHDGWTFFGSRLRFGDRLPTAQEVCEALLTSPGWQNAKEVVFCGMGEPLLRYQTVLDVCRAICHSAQRLVSIRVDTTGLLWSRCRRLDLLDWIGVLSVSLNAENAAKYEELCRPRIAGAYQVLMNFLQNVGKYCCERRGLGLPFPEVRLSIVDTSEEEFIPAEGRRGYPKGSFPVPDVSACKRIAEEFGWPLVVKRLFRDSREARWYNPSIRRMCAGGVTLDACDNCPHRH